MKVAHRGILKMTPEPLRDDTLDTAVAFEPLAQSLELLDVLEELESVPQVAQPLQNSTLGYTLLNKNDFKIIDIISSSGASSQVYQGEYVGNNGFPTDVAIKRLNRREKPGTVGAMKLAQLAMDETAKLQRMNDHALPITFGMFSTIDNDGFLTYNIVMEHVNGVTLADKIGQDNSIEQIIDWGSQILSGLEYLHDSGDDGKSVHRDIKPQNIREGEDGLLKILDLGLLTDRVDKTFGTSFRTVAGTPKYVAPEQIEGNAVPASDVYSLGIALYELFLDEPLREWSFGKTSENLDFANLEKVLYDKTKSWSQSRKISSILQKMTKLNFKERYNSAGAVKKELDKILTTTMDYNTEWSLPEREATSFARDVVGFQFLNQEDNRIQRLEEYLEGDVDSRDRKIIDQTISHLEEGRDSSFIIDNLNWYNSNFPERKVFGFKRIDILNLYGFIGKSLKVDDITTITNQPFRDLIKKSSELGISSYALNNMLKSLYDSSRTTIEVDNDKLKEHLKIIKDDEITDVDELFSRIELTKNYFEPEQNKTDLKYQALAKLLSQEEDLDEFSLNVRGKFGKRVITHYNEFDYGMISGMVLGVGAFASCLGFLGLNPGLEVEFIVSVIPAITSGGYLGYKAPQWINKTSSALTSNKFYGNINIRYSPEKVFSSLNDLLDIVPVEKIPELCEEFEKAGKDTEKSLKPYELIEKVKEVYNESC